MVSAYIDAALARCRLPIHCQFYEEPRNQSYQEWWICWLEFTNGTVSLTPREATDAYLGLVRELESQ